MNSIKYCTTAHKMSLHFHYIVVAILPVVDVCISTSIILVFCFLVVIQSGPRKRSFELVDGTC